MFLKSLITAAKSKVNPLTVNAFLGSVHEGITIDDGFGFNELIGLALDYHSFDPTNLQGQTLPTEAANGFGDLGDVLTVEQPEAQQMLVNVFGSSLTTPTNPPPDANGYPNPPPDHHPHRGGTGESEHAGERHRERRRHHDHDDDPAAVVQPHDLYPELKPRSVCGSAGLRVSGSAGPRSSGLGMSP